jgi:hypothetical protein
MVAIKRNIGRWICDSVYGSERDGMEEGVTDV